MLMVTFFLTLFFAAFFAAFFLVRAVYYFYQCEKSLYQEEIRWDLWDKAEESWVFGSVLFLGSIAFGVLWAVL